MSLRLICGRAGTGKSEFCFEEIKKNINEKSKIYMITPEQYSFTAEKKLLEKLQVGSSIKAEVLSFGRMAYRVASEVGGITKTSLSKAGKAMLIYHIMEKEKKNLTFLGKSNQNIELMDTQLTELKKHGISLEMLKNTTKQIENTYLQKKLEDISIIYEKYEQALVGKYIEENDRLEILVNQLEKTNLFNDAIFYLDEFTGFTKQEYMVIEELLKMAKQVNITITTNNLDMGTNLEQDLFYTNKQTADKLLYLARSMQIPCENTIFLDKPYRFKNSELIHLEKNIQEIPYNSYEKQVNNISIYLAQNPYLEVEHMAKEIIKLVKNNKYRYHDIVVMVKDLNLYGSLCKAILTSYKIPVFLDEKKELNQNGFAKYILALLEIYASNWSYEAVIQYLKTGFITIDEEQTYEFENYTKKWGIKGSKWYQNEWDFGEDNNKEQQERIKQIKKIYIEPIQRLKENLNGSKTIKDKNKAIYQFLLENKVEEKIKEKQKELEQEKKFELAKEQELAWNILIQVLEELNALFGKENVSFAYYRELLKIGLNQNGLGKIPQTQDQVMIGDMDRTKINNIKAIFILGVNDGSFPTIRKQEGFLNDKDRETLKEKNVELAKGTLENLYEDNFLIYKALTTAEERIYFSYSSSNQEGGALRPSTYITKLKKIFPKVKEKSDLQEEAFEIVNEQDTFEKLIEMIRREKEGEKIDSIWKIIESYYKQKEDWKYKLEQAKKALNHKNEPETINKQNIQKLYGNVLTTSVSKLEQYQSCAFSYYLKYGLKLKPQEEFKIKSIDTGTFMHEVIDSFFSIVREKELEIQELEEEQIDKIIEEIIEEKLNYSKYYIFTSNDKFKILTNKLKRVVSKSMKYLIEGLKNSDFKVMANELEFKRGKEYEPITLNLEDGRKVEITGKIDRVDMAKTGKGNYIRIIDYKSSVKSIDLNEVIAGLQIQLLTYLDATCKIEEMLPAGVLYYNLIDPILKTDKQIDKEQMEIELKKKFRMNGFILADVNVVKMMDKTLETGNSNIIPAYLDKEGNISNSKSNSVSKEQFEDLMKYTNRLIKKIAKEILSGNIEITPYYQKKNKKTACDYCEYKGICQFKEENANFHYIENKKKEEVLAKIKEEIK